MYRLGAFKKQEEKDMSNASDFIIENGVLKKYVGPGGDVVIPEGRAVWCLQLESADTEGRDEFLESL